MNYNIQLTNEFLEEFEDICYYISKKLKATNASNRLRRKVVNNILLLEKNPKIYVEIEKVKQVERTYRRMNINNYVVLYTIDEKEKIVYVSHIYYNRRNYMKFI